MPTPPFRGFEPMSVYVVFSLCDAHGLKNGRKNVGILLTRDERSDTPAELFQPEPVGETDEPGYRMKQDPKLIEKVDVRDVYARSDLQLRTAVKLNKDPLDYEPNRIRTLLNPLKFYRPGTQADWLTEIFECFSGSRKFHYMLNVEDATAQKVFELGNDLDQNPNVSVCKVFECWQEMLKELPKKQPKTSIWAKCLGR
ncbi:hypothetical protein DFH11DRAFT_1547013 [Phellopilus nigrolimitatus]|nr:hypothetical protein DFH11DRAFT_1547013 [Phellopilus nigrolimitatus]